MNKISKVAVATAVSLALGGCLEVEDNNNNADVVAALEAQGEANLAPITLFGKVINAADNLPVGEARVSIKVGTEWREPVVVSGEFSFTELPVNTDVVVLIESTDNSFMDRVFFGKTTNVDTGQVASQSMGDLKVSEAVEKSFSVLNTENSEPVEGLVFKYLTASTFSGGGTQSGLAEYEVSSTYNQDTGQYSISLAKDLYYSLTASPDIDGDGVIDVRPENNSFWSYDSIRVVSDVALQLDTMYVNETEAYQPVELRITVIDELGENIEGVEFFASDLYQGRLETTFDSDTNEYIFNYQSSSGVDLNMPSFTTADDITYQRASIDLNWASENTLSISDWGFRNNLPGSIDVVNGVASITVQPRVGSTTGNYIDRVSSAINENANF
ncbi:MAG: hypothetical protein OQK04_10035, partial [Kangiellaceae bacterium]|nr:hypothetical protein [Kangiellaceae bacterium]